MSISLIEIKLVSASYGETIDRSVWLDINAYFAQKAEDMKIELEQIYLGESPIDGTGDTIGEARKKITRNIRIVEEENK